MTFGAALRAAREAARVTRTELGKELYVLARTVARWEADENVPDQTCMNLAILALNRTERLPDRFSCSS